MSAMNTAATSIGKLLVIDSNVLFAKRLTSALRDQGFDVSHALDAPFALTMLEWDTPSAILCATNLREMNAYDIVPILHRDPKTAHIPVIAIGDDGEKGLMAAYRAGCDDCVSRQQGADSIANQIRQFLRSREEGFQPTQMLESSLTALEGNLSHLDLPGVIQMLSHSRQSGSLHINSGETDGIIVFDNGQVSHAETNELVGDDAVIQIVKNCNCAEKGVYKFIHGFTPATRTVLRSATELMLQALREIDEQERPSDEVLL
jgi:CheY-like chemotaxis protein